MTVNMVRLFSYADLEVFENLSVCLVHAADSVITKAH